MDKLKMQTENIVDENIDFIGTKFPNCIVEAKDASGKITKMVDFDLLKQELSKVVVDGDKERYVLNWPDKKQATLAANAKKKRDIKRQDVSKRLSMDNHCYIKHWGFSKNDNPVFTVTKYDKVANIEIPVQCLIELELNLSDPECYYQLVDVRYSLKDRDNGKTVSKWSDSGIITVRREDDIVLITLRNEGGNTEMSVSVSAWDLEKQIPAFKELVNKRWAKAIMNRF